ncbi:S41 family peptidase [Pedobacter sp.]|uniref:S41 family peptidase n=1 Tax=Pedobacter sp. TaxID=1411316 RepID=UPI002CF0FCC8|nr:S41 family peptidase [Pedobacter sp.]HWW41701.1 S41 family peptidase [Pedobacter sp.]
MVKARHKGLFLLLLTGVFACKKTSVIETELPVSPTTGNRTAFTLDSIYLYARQTYLWNDALPDYSIFNPRRFTNAATDLENFKAALYAISQYKINDATGFPFEKGALPGVPKYSFINPYTGNRGFVASLDTEGNGDDFGLEFASFGAEFYVRLVYPNSPADMAGVKRGDEVRFVNGTLASSATLLHGLDGASLTLDLLRQREIPLIVKLQKASYHSDPVLEAQILQVENKPVAYFAYGQFTRLSNSKEGLNRVFTDFAGGHIETMVIDLRYNHGGYVETARYLANLLATGALNNKVMCTEQYNSLMQQGKATLLKNQLYFDGNGQAVYLNGRRATYADVDFSTAGNTYHFSKAGSLQTIQNIYFLIGNETASASEMLINILKPYFKVRLIGSQTYGKPVGFFGIRIDQYNLFTAGFLIKNAQGNSDYFDGFIPDVTAEDDVRYNFGDQQESCLRAALQDIGETESGLSSRQIRVVEQKYELRSGGQRLSGHSPSFSGMLKQEMKLIKTE